MIMTGPTPSSNNMKNKTTAQDLHNIHQFLHVSEGLKKLLRHSWLSGGRQESVAEHTWRMSLMAITLHSKIESKVDLGHVLEMITVHDLAEIVATDLHAFKDVPKNKHELEEKGLKEVVKDLDEPTQSKIIALWQEFEDRKTDEAKFAVALDKLEVLIQHNEAGSNTWDEVEYPFNFIYGYDKVDHSDVLTIFRDLILMETVELVENEIK